jgi:hypothetical protein
MVFGDPQRRGQPFVQRQRVGRIQKQRGETALSMRGGFRAERAEVGQRRTRLDSGEIGDDVVLDNG